MFFVIILLFGLKIIQIILQTLCEKGDSPIALIMSSNEPWVMWHATEQSVFQLIVKPFKAL